MTLLLHAHKLIGKIHDAWRKMLQHIRFFAFILDEAVLDGAINLDPCALGAALLGAADKLIGALGCQAVEKCVIG